MMDLAMKSIASGRNPDSVIDTEMQMAADDAERDVVSWYVEAPDLDHLRYPAALLRARDLNVAIGVARSSLGFAVVFTVDARHHWSPGPNVQ